MPFSRPDAQGAGQAVFLHAHPDDEAIFTGGTMVALAQAGIGVTLVFATAGEPGGDDPNWHRSGGRRPNGPPGRSASPTSAGWALPTAAWRPGQ
ncbi:MAG: PIG-L family deacetylase [Candidatus Microthrix sp.]|nr:PIG-L family deacetylase [Candidatus Microthrix sp.]